MMPPYKPAEPPFIENSFIKLALISEKEGFLPVDPAELYRVLALGDIAITTAPEGAARHLDHVFRHQKRIGATEPARGVRHVVRECIGYHSASDLAAKHLCRLAVAVSEVDSPNLNLEEAVGLRHVGLPELIRFLDSRQAVIQEGLAKGQVNPLLTDYVSKKKREATKKYITDRVHDLKVGEIRTAIQPSIEDQNNRKRFWRSQLEEYSDYHVAKPMLRLFLKRAT